MFSGSLVFAQDNDVMRKIMEPEPLPVQKEEPLTNNDIKNYYDYYVSLYNGEKIDMEKTMDFLNRHYTQNSLIEMSSSASFDKEKKKVKLNGTDVIASARQTIPSMFKMKTNIEYKFIEVSPDHKSASIRYHITHQGYTKGEDENKKVVVIPYSSLGQCADLLTLDGRKISLRYSDCNVKSNFKLPNNND
jgi:hypothetical protein